MTIDSSGLPYWLANPTQVVTCDIPVNNHSKSVLDALGVEHLFPFQSLLISRLAAPECGDLAVSAPTGSGKTLAYCLPMVQSLLERRVKNRLRAIVVVPVKDLVGQVEETIAVVQRALTGSSIEGESSESEESDEDEDENENSSIKSTFNQLKYSILVCTPGKLQDYLSSKHASLSSLEWLIIDEADRLLDYSTQASWLPALLNQLHQEEAEWPVAWRLRCRKLLLSATLTKNPAKLAPLQLWRPELLLVSSSTESGNNTNEVEDASMSTPPGLHEGMILVVGADTAYWRLAALIHFLRECGGGKLLIFCTATETAERLSAVLGRVLSGGAWVRAFHAHLAPEQRRALLEEFKSAGQGDVGKGDSQDGKDSQPIKFHILVTTDALARGIHLPDISVVINYDCPAFSSTYVHRVGRTARAMREGIALSIVPQEAGKHMRGLLERQLKKRVLPLWREEFLVRLRELKAGIVGKIEMGERELAYLQESLDKCL